MLRIGIQYLTGYVVATDTGNRGRAEWPPHPGRVFMALAAAYFETRPNERDSRGMTEWQAEGDVLRWMESLAAPHIKASEASSRDVVTVYVPPNDMGANSVTSIPAFRTNRQPRTFPTLRPDDDCVVLAWPDAEPSAVHVAALSRLCRKVIRIGHSSSLVQLWVLEHGGEFTGNIVPGDLRSRTANGYRMRVVGRGTLDYLSREFNGQAIEDFYEMTIQIEESKGKAQKEAKARFGDRFGVAWRKGLPPPSSRRPVLSMTQAYRRDAVGALADVVSTVFDPNMMTLALQEGQVLGLEATWRVLTALRGFIESQCQPTPEWVSGHKPDGSPTETPHLALLPLAYVGADHADGHLMGLALAFPREVDAQARGEFVARLLFGTDTARPRPVRLTLGDLGVWTLSEEERVSPPLNLRPETWTAEPKGAIAWASASPVVLDRHPRADPLDPRERVEFIREAQDIIAESCIRIGLPEPVKIDVDKTSWLQGAPRAKPGPNGYPLMPIRNGGPNRRQVHVKLRFDQPVVGPVILGAGRYRGYGLCRPVDPNSKWR